MPSKLTRAALLLTCFFLSSTCEAQVNPAVKTHAYEMDVIGGIPGGPPGVGAPARQTRHVIFLETAPSAQFSVEGVWMNGKFHSVETATKKPPVRFDSPVKLAQDDKSVAVPATTNTVTEIVVKDPAPGQDAGCGHGPDARRAPGRGPVELSGETGSRAHQEVREAGPHLHEVTAVTATGCSATRRVRRWQRRSSSRRHESPARRR